MFLSQLRAYYERGSCANSKRSTTDVRHPCGRVFRHSYYGEAGIETAPKFGDLKGRSALRSPAAAYSGEIANGPFCWELGLPIGGS